MLKRTTIISLSIITILLINCSKSDSIQIYRPANVICCGDSVVYVYDGNGRFSEIDFWSGNKIHERNVATYSNGKIVKFRKSYPIPNSPDYPGPIYTFEYGSNGLPSYIVAYLYGNFDIPSDTIYFTHDNLNRLVKRETRLNNFTYNYTRYEYSPDNNVTKTYYGVDSSTPEILGAEYFTFDNHKRFFAGSPELTIIEVYVFEYQPSINNAITMRQSGGKVFSYGTPADVTYQITYNNQGLVNSVTTNYSFSSELIFHSMNYACN